MDAGARARWAALACVLVVLVTLIATDHISMSLSVGKRDGPPGQNIVATGDAPAGTPVAAAPGAAPTAVTGTAGATTTAAPTSPAAGAAPTTGGAAPAGGASSAGGGPAPTAAPADPGAPPDEPAAAPEAPAPELAEPEAAEPEAAEAVDPCHSGPFGATDQGITEETIKLGFITVSGITEEHRVALERIPQAWIQEINSTGGVCGRQLEYVLEHSTYADEAAQLATCKSLVLDKKVFSVIAYASFNTSAGQMCVAKDNSTPLLSWDQLPSHYYQDAAPYLWLSRLDESRMLKNFARTIVEKGYIDASMNVGVLYEGTPWDSEAVEGDMLPELQRLGITPARVYKSSPSLEASINQMPDAVLQMRQAGVTHLIFVASVITKQQFIRHADAQMYYPRLLDHDIKDGCGELLHEFAAPYPDRSFDGTICVTAHFTGIDPANQTSQFGENINSPFALYADEVYNRWNPGGYEAVRGNPAEYEVGFNPGTQRFLNYIVGGHVEMWKGAAERAGRNLTRPDWGQAMMATGRFEHTAFAPYFTFGPEKFDGPDEIRVVQFQVEASDGYERRKFRPLEPFFPAWY